jgi:hypothetical protein
MVTKHGSRKVCLPSSKMLRQLHGAEYFSGNEGLAIIKIILNFMQPNTL